ncbi:trypsin-7-like [Colias croceus]|uniref:trypsin-7-like n=1 Tax=Colias crocea TaxID=72248 RepID=UPI001E27F228|nr:trypsin-7-like [Colias croceus]
MTMFAYILFILPEASSYRYLPALGLIPYSSTSERDLLANITEIPHHVLIVYSTWYCSGSLTGSRIVVTAASCFARYKGETITVKVGAESITANGQVITVIEMKTHEYFRHLNKIDNDIAMLVLKDHVNFEDGGGVQKAMPIEADVAFHINTPLNVYGWGGPEKAVKYQNMPLCSVMAVMEKLECQKQYGHLITPSNFCVRYNPQRNLSDNGGGAIFNKSLVGILSAGGTSSKGPYFAILTNISYFNKWIKLNTKNFLNKYCSMHNSGDYYHIDSVEFPEA